MPLRTHTGDRLRVTGSAGSQSLDSDLSPLVVAL